MAESHRIRIILRAPASGMINTVFNSGSYDSPAVDVRFISVQNQSGSAVVSLHQAPERNENCMVSKTCHGLFGTSNCVSGV